METTTITTPVLGDDPDRLLTEPELLAYLAVSDRTLRAWRTAGRAPRCIRLGKHNRYRAADVRDWLDTRYAA